MKSKLPLLLGAVAVLGVLFVLWRRSRLPSNFNSLPQREQERYLALLDRAASYTGPTE